MDVLEYFKIKKRMTNKCEMKCDECPLYDKSNNKQLGCKRFEMLYPNEAIQIVERWEKEHPIMTNAEKYEQMMKNLLGDDFEIEICPSKSHDVPGCACEKMNNCNDCVKFWNSEYRKKEEE